MLKHLNIRQRMLITFLAIVVTGGLVQMIIAGRQLQQITQAYDQEHLETDARMLAAILAEPLEASMQSNGTEEMQRLLNAIQQGVDLEYLILDQDYHVIGYTPGIGYEAVDRVPLTPELQTAEPGSMGRDTRIGHDGVEHVYVALPIRLQQATIGYVVLSHQTQLTEERIMEQWLQLGLTTLPVIGLVIIASSWLSGTISRPVQDLRNSALKMADGAFDTRIERNAHDEVGQLAKTFNYMAERIEDLMTKQRSFVSNAAHELRTPLMTLKLRADALIDEDLPPETRRQYLHEIGQEVNHMAHLVSSLLVLARLDEGRHQSNGRVTDSAATLNDIARHWRIAAKQAQLVCEPHIPDDLPDLPLTPNDLRLVLDNLLENALKYTQAGIVRLTVGHEDGWMTMEVSDTGIGFAPDQAHLLFNRFYRTEDTRTRFEGKGLGLAIVKAVLDHYGAHITASSDGIGQGATFTVRVPI